MAAGEVVPRQADQAGTRLRAGAIGYGGATMQAVATIAPAIAGLFFTQYVVSLTGVTAPLAIAHRLWGAGWVLVLAAMFSSTLAVCQACNNVSTRIWFKMGETGTLPKWFAAVHPVHKTPKNAILANLALSLGVGLGVGFGLNASRSYLLTNGLILVLAVLYIYVSANFAVAFYYLRFRRDEFNWLLHIGFPVISTAALVYVTIKSFQPFPSFPYNYAPLIDGAWLAIGIAILAVLWLRGKTDWLEKAAGATVDTGELPQEWD
jgi:amino acid transporter